MRKSALVLTTGIALALGAAAPAGAQGGPGCSDFGSETVQIAQESPGNLAALIQGALAGGLSIGDVVASEHAEFCA